ncbi:MAG TPA: hypothetical protein VI072_00645, partial [Polyangiaceae bacterium]
MQVSKFWRSLCVGWMAVASFGCSEPEHTAERPQLGGCEGDAGPGAAGACARDGGSLGVPCDKGVSDGELQNRASGASVFGKVIVTEPNEFLIGVGRNCGAPGVSVCLHETQTCTVSDAAGQFVLSGLPESGELAIRFEKPGFVPVVRLVTISGAPANLFETRIVTTEFGTALYADVGETIDSSKGSIIAHGLQAGEGIGSIVLPGDVSITLTPGVRRPVYSAGASAPAMPASDDLDVSLPATRFGGWALFTNVPPGDYVMRFERAG